MRRALVIASLVLGICLTSGSFAGAEEAPPAMVANLRVVDIDVQLFPVLIVGMEIPIVTVKVKNTGTVPTPAFSVSTRVSFYGTSASEWASQEAAGLEPGEARTFSFRLRPQIFGVREPHGITAIAQHFPGELERTDNRLFEILEF